MMEVDGNELESKSQELQRINNYSLAWDPGLGQSLWLSPPCCPYVRILYGIFEPSPPHIWAFHKLILANEVISKEHC